MITERTDIDLKLLAGHFTEDEGYEKSDILKELEYWRSITDFLVLVSENDDKIDGFVIGFKDRNSLWLSQVWSKNGNSEEGMKRTEQWAKKRNLKYIRGETGRNEMKAMSKYGFREASVIMEKELKYG